MPSEPIYGIIRLLAADASLCGDNCTFFWNCVLFELIKSRFERARVFQCRKFEKCKIVYMRRLWICFESKAFSCNLRGVDKVFTYKAASIIAYWFYYISFWLRYLNLLSGYQRNWNRFEISFSICWFLYWNKKLTEF